MIKGCIGLVAEDVVYPDIALFKNKLLIDSVVGTGCTIVVAFSIGRVELELFGLNI